MGGGDNFKILWRGHSCYEGGHRAHGVPPSPPTRENPGAGQTLFGIFFASVTICQVITSQVKFAVIACRQASSTTFYATLGEAML